jgi:hypothetical protein
LKSIEQELQHTNQSIAAFCKELRIETPFWLWNYKNLSNKHWCK